MTIAAVSGTNAGNNGIVDQVNMLYLYFKIDE